MAVKQVTSPGKLSGIPLVMDGQTYIVPPLNLDAAELYLDDMEKLDTPGAFTGRERMRVMRNIILVAIQRNYPEITDEVLGKHMNMGDISPTLVGIGEISRPPAGDEDGAGDEGKPPSTGGDSDQRSLPLPAGQSTTSAST